MGRLGRLGLEPPRRYQRSRPGELVHLDVKKLGRILGGAGWRVRDRKQHYNPTYTDPPRVRRLRPRDRLPAARDQTPPHAALPPTDQRQSRALHRYPARVLHRERCGSEHRVDERPGVEANRVARREPGLPLGLRDRGSCVLLAEPTRVERDGGDPRRARRQRDPLVELDEVAQRRDPVRATPCTFDRLASGLVAEDEQMRGAAVVEAERDARVDRVQERALALDPEPATTASMEMPQPAIAIPVCPVGTKTEARPRRRASRSSSSATVIFPIAQSEPTVRTIVPGTSRFAPVAVESPSGGRRRSRSSTPCRAASARSSGSSARKTWSPFSMSSPPAMQDFRSSIQAGGKRPPCVATPTRAVVDPRRTPSPTSATTGIPFSDSPPRVESRTAATSSCR